MPYTQGSEGSEGGTQVQKGDLSSPESREFGARLGARRKRTKAIEKLNDHHAALGSGLSRPALLCRPRLPSRPRDLHWGG